MEAITAQSQTLKKFNIYEKLGPTLPAVGFLEKYVEIQIWLTLREV